MNPSFAGLTDLQAAALAAIELERRRTLKAELNNGLAEIRLPSLLPPYQPLLTERRRYKVFYGGRGGAKSWSIAEAAIQRAHTRRTRFLCTREFQNSIKDSVYRLLVDTLDRLGLRPYFKINHDSIVSLITGSEFIFKGIARGVIEVKSTEGIDVCWIAEAQCMSAESWEVLPPTIRAPGSEIWIDFNTPEEDAPTYKNIITYPPRNAYIRKINFDENPHFTAELEEERQRALDKITQARDEEDRKQLQADYDHVWLGFPRRLSQAAIFRSRVYFEVFDTPEDGSINFKHGGDFGFADDPSVLLRCWIKTLPNGDEELYIDREAFGWHVEIDDLAVMYSGGVDIKGKEWPGIATAGTWPIFADSSRPETISYLRRKGFNIEAADKWPGSVEDGITHLKGFKRIVIHEKNCPNMATEARLYSFKVDKQTKKILPVVVDANNHGWDACRYSLNGFIQNRGGLGVWAKLGMS